MTLQGTNTSRVFAVYLMSPTTARGNTKARRKDPQLLAPAAAQAAVISVKAKKCAFQFPREMSESGLNGFSQVPSGFCVSSPTFSNPSCLMLTQPSHHTGFWCVRSHRLSQLTCITAEQQSSFCSISGTTEDSGFYAPVMGSTQILCRFPN